MEDDKREAIVKCNLRQLYSYELVRLLTHLDNGREISLHHLYYDDTRAAYCPMAIAIGLPTLIRHSPTDQKVAMILELLGLNTYNIRGVPGSFYTTNRQDDLYYAARDVLAERNQGKQHANPAQVGGDSEDEPTQPISVG